MYKFLGIKVNLGGVGLGYRYYITHVKKPVPSGFYVNPQAAFSFGSVADDNDVMVSANTFGIGAELGYQWAWESGFVLDLGIGPMYTFVREVTMTLSIAVDFYPAQPLLSGMPSRKDSDII